MELFFRTRWDDTYLSGTKHPEIASWDSCRSATCMRRHEQRSKALEWRHAVKQTASQETGAVSAGGRTSPPALALIDINRLHEAAPDGSRALLPLVVNLLLSLGAGPVLRGTASTAPYGAAWLSKALELEALASRVLGTGSDIFAVGANDDDVTFIRALRDCGHSVTVINWSHVLRASGTLIMFANRCIPVDPLLVSDIRTVNSRYFAEGLG